MCVSGVKAVWRDGKLRLGIYYLPQPQLLRHLAGDGQRLGLLGLLLASGKPPTRGGNRFALGPGWPWTTPPLSVLTWWFSSHAEGKLEGFLASSQSETVSESRA